MTEEKREELCRKAVELKRGGLNCAQAVACAFAGHCGLDEETLRDSAWAFGSGNTTTEGTCGAITGAGIVLGMTHRDRAGARGAMTRLMKEFKGRNGATVCRDLKGLDTGVPLRPCEMCVRDAAEFLSGLLPEERETFRI